MVSSFGEPDPRASSHHRSARAALHTPLGPLRLAFADATADAEFLADDVEPLVAIRLPWICGLVALVDAIHLGARVREWPRAGGGVVAERAASAALVPAIAAWTLLGLATLVVRTRAAGEANRGAAAQLRALSVGLGVALALDALPLDVLAQPSLLGPALAPGLAALALQHLVAPLVVACFAPVAPSTLAGAAAVAVGAHALAGARAGLRAGVVVQCVAVQALALALLVAHRWDAGAIARARYHRARHAWAGHARTHAAMHNASQMHAALTTLAQEEAVRGAEEAAAIARAELIRILSHDMRGPLLVSAAVASELTELSGSVAARDALALAERKSIERLCGALEASTASLARIVSELSAFGLAESQELRLARGAFFLRQLTDALGRSASARAAEAKGVTLRIEALTADATGCRVAADLARLVQALEVALSNAINASARGGTVRVALTLADPIDQQLFEFEVPESAAGWVLVCVRVIDHGVGLDADALADAQRGAVFSRVGVGQLNGSAATGVGLAHARRLLELHDGSTLHLRSDGPRRGCVCELRLHLRRAADHDPLAPPWLPPPSGAGIRSSVSAALAAIGRPGGVAPPAPGGGGRDEKSGHSALRTAGASADLESGSYTALRRTASPASAERRLGRRLGSSRACAVTRALLSSPARARGLKAGAGSMRDLRVGGDGPERAPVHTDAAVAAAQQQQQRQQQQQHERSLSTRARLRLQSMLSSLSGLGGGQQPQQPPQLPPHGSDGSVASAHTTATPWRAGEHTPSPVRSGSGLARARNASGRVQPTAPTAPTAEAEGGAETVVRALYAEDDPVVRLMVQLRVFDALGVDVELASDGAEAMRLYEARAAERAARGLPTADAYAFILLDNQMPHMNGSQVAHALRASGCTARIVGLTGDPKGCADRTVFELSGIDCCLDKDAASLGVVREMLAACGATVSGALPGEPAMLR